MQDRGLATCILSSHPNMVTFGSKEDGDSHNVKVKASKNSSQQTNGWCHGGFTLAIDTGIKVQVCSVGIARDSFFIHILQRDRVTGQNWSLHVSKYLQLWLLTTTQSHLQTWQHGTHGSSCVSGTCSHDCVRHRDWTCISRNDLSLSSSYLLSLPQHMTAFTPFFCCTFVLKSSSIPASRCSPLHYSNNI